MKIHLFRHGEATYTQGRVSLEEAQDLTEGGIAFVEKQSEALARSILPGETVEIWSSPIGRTLHTAKILAAGLGLAEIRIADELEEVRGFDYDLMEGLVSGGEVECEGAVCKIDAGLTNPDHLEHNEYYSKDVRLWLTAEAKQQLSESYLHALEVFETGLHLTSRIIALLRQAVTTPDAPDHLVLVSHNGSTAFPMSIFSRGMLYGVVPCERIDLEYHDGKLTVQTVGGSQEGDRETDLFETFQTRLANGNLYPSA